MFIHKTGLYVTNITHYITLAFNFVPVQGSAVSDGLLLLSHPGFHQLSRVLRAAHPAAPRGGGVQGVLRSVSVQSWGLSWSHQGLLRAWQPQQSHQGFHKNTHTHYQVQKLLYHLNLCSSSTQTCCFVYEEIKVFGPRCSIAALKFAIKEHHLVYTGIVWLCSLHLLHTFHHWELLFDRSALTNAYGP